MFAGLIFFHFQKLSSERAGLAELNIVQKEWMAVVPYLLSLEFQKVCIFHFRGRVHVQSIRGQASLLLIVRLISSVSRNLRACLRL